MKMWSKTSALRIAAAIVLIPAITFSLHLVRINSSAIADFPCDYQSKSSTNIHVETGQSGSEIARTLYQAGVVKSSEAYFRIAVSDPRSQKVAPGNHRIDLRICAKSALDQLLDTSRISGLINIVEGAWLSELTPQFRAANFSDTEIAQALKELQKPKGFTSVEGLLFPAQYSFAKDTSALSALQSMVNRASDEMKEAGFFTSKEKFTPYQFLIIASLVQAEGNTEDFPKISQVIRNRLTKGMPLQFDSTVHYVKKSRGSVFLSTQSTLIDSPYNTYRRYGLPPGPINNPGSDALRAATHPTAGNWLYFITVAPFDTRFTSDINQFNNWKIEYKKNLRAGKFRSSE